MNSRLTLWSRFSALLSLLLHLTLVGVGPVVDARLELEASTADAAAHVEDAGDSSCAPGHAHQVCLVRALHSMDVPPEGAAPAVAPKDSPLRPNAAPLVAPTAALAVSALGPRAPPAA